MPDSAITPPSETPQFTWNTEVVFAMLAEKPRRGLLAVLARGGGQAATLLTGNSGKRLDATLKHLTALKKFGMVTAKPDTKDRRRTLYGLSPNVTVVRSEAGAP